MKIGKFSWIKLAAMLLALVMCLAAVGCGDTADTESGADNTESSGEGGNDTPRFDGPTLSVGDKVKMGVYFDESGDKMAPLSWTVLKVEKDRALIITDKCIDYVPYHKTAYEPGSEIIWETSSIREFLNGEFYGMIFTPKEKEKILNGGAEDKIAIANTANIRTDLGESDATFDKVFLLSADEAEELFENNAARVAKSTVFAMDNGARVENGNAAWFLRTTGEAYDRAAVVSHNGEINYSGYNVNFGSAAVRPCIWIATNTDYKEENPVVSFASAKVGSRVSFGDFEKDGNDANGKEDLIWTVAAVEGDKMLLVTENVIEMQQYSNIRKDAWDTSPLRKWLGETFFVDAFSAEEQAKILDTAVSAGKNPETGIDCGNDTTDKVFVLSIEEVLKYFPEQDARQATATAYAVNNGVSVDPNYKTSGYWTRDLGETTRDAAYVYYYGGINYDGVMLRTDYIGVRPAIWVAK